MNKKINNLLCQTAFMLIFALLSGFAYLAVIYELVIKNTNGGGLILFFFCPAIVCGAALILIKLIRQCRENEEYSKVSALFWSHTALMVIALCIALV